MKEYSQQYNQRDDVKKRRREEMRLFRERHPEYYKTPKYKEIRRACNKRLLDVLKQENPDAFKRRHKHYHLRKYNITIVEYEQLLAAQGGVCYICRNGSTKRMLAVDHDHVTGELRKLLCGACNSGLGLFKENTIYLAEAIKYIQRHHVKQMPPDLKEKIRRARARGDCDQHGAPYGPST